MFTNTKANKVFIMIKGIPFVAETVGLIFDRVDDISIDTQAHILKSSTTRDSAPAVYTLVFKALSSSQRSYNDISDVFYLIFRNRLKNILAKSFEIQPFATKLKNKAKEIGEIEFELWEWLEDAKTSVTNWYESLPNPLEDLDNTIDKKLSPFIANSKDYLVDTYAYQTSQDLYMRGIDAYLRYAKCDIVFLSFSTMILNGVITQINIRENTQGFVDIVTITVLELPIVNTIPNTSKGTDISILG